MQVERQDTSLVTPARGASRRAGVRQGFFRVFGVCVGAAALRAVLQALLQHVVVPARRAA
jgi:hypothetical protein